MKLAEDMTTDQRRCTEIGSEPDDAAASRLCRIENKLWYQNRKKTPSSFPWYISTVGDIFIFRLLFGKWAAVFACITSLYIKVRCKQIVLCIHVPACMCVCLIPACEYQLNSYLKAMPRNLIPSRWCMMIDWMLGELDKTSEASQPLPH